MGTEPSASRTSTPELVAGAPGQGLLTTCPVCGHEVSRRARLCPHCGHGLRGRRFNVRLAALGIGVLFVATIAAAGLGISFRLGSSPLPLTTEQVIALVQPSVVTVKVT